VDTILVLMQVGRDGDWTDRGLPEVVTGYDRADSPVVAGAEWMFDHHPSPVSDDWRLLVWANIRNGAWHRETPDAVVTPALYRASIADRGLSRGNSRRRPGRLSAQPVISKIRADEVELGELVLLTCDVRNAAVRSAGAWHIADRDGAGCVAARVRRLSVMIRGDQESISLVTGIGEIDRLPAGQPVIPVDEDC